MVRNDSGDTLDLEVWLLTRDQTNKRAHPAGDLFKLFDDVRLAGEDVFIDYKVPVMNSSISKCCADEVSWRCS